MLLIAAAVSIKSPLCENHPDRTFIASLDNDRNYFICIDGAALNFQCQSGYFADENSRSCKYITPYIDTNVCYDKDTNTFVDNPANCGAYWICVEGDAIPVQCPAGSPNFNPETKTCETNEAFPCSDERESETEEPFIPDETTTELTTTEAPLNPCHQKPNGWFANDPRRCPAYFLCWNNLPRSQECDNEVPFNEAEQMCDWKYECNDEEEQFATTTIATTTEPQPLNPCANQENGFYANDERSCPAYFLCWDEFPFERYCEDDLPFNEEDQLCDWQFECEDPVTISPPETTTKEDQTTTEQETTTPEEETTQTTTEEATEETTETTTEEFTETTSETTTEQTTESTTEEVITTTEDPEPTADCPPGENTNILFPGSCTRYWMCLNGVGHPRECATGLHFDAFNRGCNTPDNANCAREFCPIVDDPNNMVTKASTEDCAE